MMTKNSMGVAGHVSFCMLCASLLTYLASQLLNQWRAYNHLTAEQAAQACDKL